MATIYNSDLQKEYVEGGKIQVSREGSVNQISQQVIPVMEVNPKLLRRCNYFQSRSSTAGTIATTSADKDTFIVACSLGIDKLVTDTGTDAVLKATVDGVQINLLYIPGITLTLNQQNITISFPFPIKLDRNTTIITSGSNITKIAGLVIGYTIENVTA